ncbi:DUF4113 domain-containing protein [Polaromonas sp. CG_9.11]|nr:DUF4113 domain-containing protein [Polaromonas sp. CG_9.11]MBG6075352.1 hypothetical protein [Polaromonas sp. CG_9.11]
MLVNIQPNHIQQDELELDDLIDTTRLMSALDTINQRYG